MLVIPTIRESRKQSHNIYSVGTNGTRWKASFKELLIQPKKGIPIKKEPSVSKHNCWRWHGLHLKANWMPPLYCITLTPPTSSHSQSTVACVESNPKFVWRLDFDHLHPTTGMQNKTPEGKLFQHNVIFRIQSNSKTQLAKLLLPAVKICCQQDSLFWLKNVYC